MSPKNTAQKVACIPRTMVKLFLRIHLGCSEECQILINSTTQQLKAFRETGKTFLHTSFLPFPSHSTYWHKRYLNICFVFDTDAPMTTYKNVAKKTNTHMHTSSGEIWPHVLQFSLLNYVTQKDLDKLVSVSRTKGFDNVFMCTFSKECFAHEMKVQYVATICAL